MPVKEILIKFGKGVFEVRVTRAFMKINVEADIVCFLRDVNEFLSIFA